MAMSLKERATDECEGGRWGGWAAIRLVERRHHGWVCGAWGEGCLAVVDCMSGCNASVSGFDAGWGTPTNHRFLVSDIPIFFTDDLDHLKNPGSQQFSVWIKSVQSVQQFSKLKSVNPIRSKSSTIFGVDQIRSKRSTIFETEKCETQSVQNFQSFLKFFDWSTYLYTSSELTLQVIRCISTHH